MDFGNLGSSNPLPDTVQVAVASPELVAGVAVQMKSMDATEEVSYGQELVKRLTNSSATVPIKHGRGGQVKRIVRFAAIK